ncbi:polysaccharide deacetylase family protein [bacterium]|nr:polysaccharide deacetylase family protein [bacterium]
MVTIVKSSCATATLMHRIGPPMVVGIAFHGSTAQPLGEFNIFGKFMDAGTLERQLSFITGHFRVVALSEIVRRLHACEPLPRKTVFLTFDDCYAGNFHHAFPVLKKFGVPATFFAPTFYIGSDLPFPLDLLDAAVKHTRLAQVEISGIEGASRLDMRDDKEKLQAAITLHSLYKAFSADQRESFTKKVVRQLGFSSTDSVPFPGEHTLPMTWEHVREMHRAGMEFGSHTHRHTILARIPEADAKAELAASKSLLENALNEPCTLFCYPNGGYPQDGNERTNELVRQAGYSCAVYMGGGINLSSTDPYFIARECFGQNTSQEEMAALLASAGHRIRALLGRDRSPHARSLRAAKKRPR